MNADITLLQNQAAQAVPAWPKPKTGPVGRWSPLWPVYAELRRKGFSIREAIDWLIREGAVPAKDRKKAENGLPMVDSRRRRGEAVAMDGTAPTGALKETRGRARTTSAKSRARKSTRRKTHRQAGSPPPTVSQEA